MLRVQKDPYPKSMGKLFEPFVRQQQGKGTSRKSRETTGLKPWLKP